MGINKYNNSCIYKIWKDNFIYIGSTCNFIRRMNEHKSSCNNINSQRRHLKIYQTIRLHGGWDEFEKEIIKHVCCENRKELHKLEGEFIKNIGTMNCSIAGRSKKKKKKIICPICGIFTIKCNIKRHQQSKRCMKYQ